MKNSIFFSVIVPVYNGSDKVTRCLNSIKSQVFKDFEICIVNDGSKDSSDNIINRFIQSNQDLKINYIKFQENMGISAARNQAISISKGKYICFLDHDDFWLPNKLSEVYKTIELHNPDFIWHQAYLNSSLYKKKGVTQIKKLSRPYYDNLLFYGNVLSTSTVTIRRKSLAGLAFDITHKNGEEDYAFFLKYMKKKVYIFFINKKLSYYDFEDSGITNKIFEHSNATINLIKKEFTDLTLVKRYSKKFLKKRLNQRISKEYFHISRVMMLRNLKIEAKENLNIAIKLYPSSLKYYLFFFILRLKPNWVGKKWN